MKTKSKLFLSSAIGLGMLTAFLSTAQAAEVVTNVKSNPMSSLVLAISQKFGLNQAEVQQVFDAERVKSRTEMEAKATQALNDRLAKAVTDKKLTQAQADMIKAEVATLKTQFEALNGKTGQELKDGMKAIMDSAKKWAKDNNIPEQYLVPGFGGRGFGHKIGMGMMMGHREGKDK